MPDPLSDEPDEILRPLPQGLRAIVDSLDDPPPGFQARAPEWARKLIHAHMRDELDEQALRPYASPGEEGDFRVLLAYEGALLELDPGGTCNVAFASGGKKGPIPDADGWFLPRLTDYWDARVDAIKVAGERLEALPNDQEREAALDEIEAAVEEHCRVLADEFLIAVAVSFADDLYKQANTIQIWGESWAQYLRASGGRLCRQLSDRGFRIQYLVDNSWEDTTRLFELMPDWYRTAGFTFACPLLALPGLIEGGDTSLEQALSERPEDLLAEARQVTSLVAERCRDEGRHFVQVEPDYVDCSFEVALQAQADPGVLTILRSEAPEPGSKIKVVAPEGINYPPSATGDRGA